MSSVPYKEFERQRWTALALEWLKWVDETEQVNSESARLNQTLFDRTGLREGAKINDSWPVCVLTHSFIGMQVLDLCCGEGELCLQASTVVGAFGRYGTHLLQ